MQSKTAEIGIYNRLEAAIEYIIRYSDQQPTLAETAKIAHLSQFHFQRLFSEWAGISPKRFLDQVNLLKAKILMQRQNSIEEVSYKVGLSSPSRLYDLFIKVEAMTPGEFKNHGKGLAFYINDYPTTLGRVSIASTVKGISHISFGNLSSKHVSRFKENFSSAIFKHEGHSQHRSVIDVINSFGQTGGKLNFHLKGTPFQHKVWQALIDLEPGEITTYRKLASKIDQPKALAAVSNAVVSNPIALLIPCHRVIQSKGLFGEYKWSETKKATILTIEQSIKSFKDHEQLF
jgi:AraC family transcriptional regulator of adaptative response/methylated-DNA-[protein]-cysteine methyltransferase